MLDRELWLFINTFAEWFSALGTIAAVIVALHLARRDARITLKVAVGIRLMLQRGVEGRPEFFSLAVTNIGRRPARITGIAMRDGLNVGVKRFRVGSYMFMLPPQNALSADVPKTITDGETAHYLVAWPEFVRVNGDLIRGHFGGRLGWFRARFLRVGVDTSAGGTFDARIERRLAERLLEAARAAS